ncbi:MAG TPA: hypothetical protein VFF27_16105 [Bacteroidia bacterium]|nr:hypothetical protein [Bacteroidia bacterium]
METITLRDSKNWIYDPTKLDWENELKDKVLMDFPSSSKINQNDQGDGF